MVPQMMVISAILDGHRPALGLGIIWCQVLGGETHNVRSHSNVYSRNWASASPISSSNSTSAASSAPMRVVTSGSGDGMLAVQSRLMNAIRTPCASARPHSCSYCNFPSLVLPCNNCLKASERGLVQAMTAPAGPEVASSVHCVDRVYCQKGVTGNATY